MSLVDDLARELGANYRTAKPSEKVVQIHLFGISKAEALKSVSLPEVLSRAGMPVSYKTELRKGMRLAPFVQLK